MKRSTALRSDWPAWPRPGAPSLFRGFANRRFPRIQLAGSRAPLAQEHQPRQRARAGHYHTRHDGCHLLRPHRPRDRRPQGGRPPLERARGRLRPPHPVRLLRQGLRAPRVRLRAIPLSREIDPCLAKRVFGFIDAAADAARARGDAARAGGPAARAGANARPSACARRRERAPTSRPDASRVRRHRPRGPDREDPPALRAPSQSVFRAPPSRNGREASRAAAPAPAPARASPRPATGATRAATGPRARPHRAPNAPRAPRVTSRSRPDRSTSRARDAALVGGARLGGKYQSSARAMSLLYRPGDSRADASPSPPHTLLLVSAVSPPLRRAVTSRWWRASRKARPLGSRPPRQARGGMATTTTASPRGRTTSSTSSPLSSSARSRAASASR